MTTTYKGYRITANAETRKIECQSISNPVEVSYHDWDELADDENEAIEFFIEWLDETK